MIFGLYVHTPRSRVDDEIEYFSRRMTDEELARYERNTTKHPVFWLCVLATFPFIGELLCRIAAGVW